MSPNAVVANNSTMMIDRRNADDMSKSPTENGPDTTARYGHPIRQRCVSQMPPTLYCVDAAYERRASWRELGIWQVAHHQMDQRKNAAGQRRCSQQLNHTRQRQTNRQCNQQFDVAAANRSALVDHKQQQEQDRSDD